MYKIKNASQPDLHLMSKTVFAVTNKKTELKFWISLWTFLFLKIRRYMTLRGGLRRRRSRRLPRTPNFKGRQILNFKLLSSIDAYGPIFPPLGEKTVFFFRNFCESNTLWKLIKPIKKFETAYIIGRSLVAYQIGYIADRCLRGKFQTLKS